MQHSHSELDRGRDCTITVTAGPNLRSRLCYRTQQNDLAKQMDPAITAQERDETATPPCRQTRLTGTWQ
ncbi:hypothetical protein EYF80_008994 [Liparis tanakae]|uniref:Uncharacterized protein n=1 Tax=Liparis tanakae TaxID=230148 RepID=A0A4Z2IRW2_9TELE|nr:hypothetical protein EYF80_008994 [Liparis tanakae]